MSDDPISILGASISRTFEYFSRTQSKNTEEQWQEIHDRNDAVQIMLAASRLINAENDLIKWKTYSDKA